MRPAVITDVKDDSRLIQEEIFGPVTCVLPFDTEEEAIRRANNVQYGLCATVWTTNVTTLHRVSRELQVIRDNTPVVYILYIVKVFLFARY
jgi:acyl-CoA reductase-like NAD-dependent aldehyde dehydrogenase